MTTYTNGGSQASATYYAIKDHQNTIIALTDSIGTVVESYEYDAYGCVLSVKDGSGNPQVSGLGFPVSSLGNRYMFQGREYDSATGLYYFRARWYNPVSGRWLSKDPIGISGGLNLYVFCGSNPINFTDPFGMDSKNEFIQKVLKEGDLYNATSKPVRVIGSDEGGRREWDVAPGKWGSDNKYGIQGVDGVYVGEQVIKIKGRMGTWVHIPGIIRPSDYSGHIGWFFRGFGLNKIVDPEKEFGPLLTDKVKPE